MDNNETEYNYIHCHMCNQNIDITNYFFHIRNEHPILLTTLASLYMPDITDIDLINIFNIEPEVDPYSYENLSELCDQLGNVKIGVKDIDEVSVPIVINTENKNDNNCSICLESYNYIQKQNDNYIRKINLCHHKFCNTCITQWLSSNKKCPICKIELISNVQVEDDPK